MEEIWKDIKNYEGIYQVSNLGRIKSFKFKKEKVLKLSSNPLGYSIVNLWRRNKRKSYSVHRIVAETFIKNSDNKEEVNHIDGNKKNNIITNLEWVTKSENMKHAIKKGLLKIEGNKIIPKEIIQLDLKDNVIKIWRNHKEITNNYGFKNPHIYDCCTGKRKTAYGYKWKYKNELDVGKTY